MAVRMYPNVKSAVWEFSDWVELAKGIELSEMKFSHENGKVVDIYSLRNVLI